MTQIDTLKASRPRHNFPLAAKTKTKRKTIQTHAFSRQISSQTLSLLAILVEVPDVEKNSQEDTFIPPPYFCSVRLEKIPKTYFSRPKTCYHLEQSPQYQSLQMDPSQRPVKFKKQNKLQVIKILDDSLPANRKTFSITRLHDAFRKTLLKAAN